MSFKKSKHSVRLLRHATLIVKVRDVTFLVDPMLSQKGSMDPVGNAGNDIRIPMVDLPIDTVNLKKILDEVDAILVTHTHRDHWDVAAQQMIDKSKPIFCQPTDLEKIKEQGFTNVTSVEKEAKFKDVIIYRTTGQHGTGDIGQKMGHVSGFVLDDLYIAGDTIWCNDVASALEKFKPQTVVVNAGGAQFLTGDPVTMNEQDVMSIAKTTKSIIAVHMDTINHCRVTRPVLKKFVAENNLNNVVIPDDGATLTF